MMLKGFILCVGDELLTGQTLDANSPWLAQELSAQGVTVVGMAVAPDQKDALIDAIRHAAAGADVLIITGGLGPTEDDLTRPAIADLLAVPLVEDATSLRDIEAFFSSLGRRMSDANRVQAALPRGARAIRNTCGTAPGIRARYRDTTIFALPGVPHEMRVMFAQTVIPEIAGAGGACCYATRTLYTHGIGESDLGERIRDLMARGRNPAVGTTAKQGVIGIRIYARGASGEEAQALLDRDARELRGRLGNLIFGADDERLAAAVAGLLREKRRTIATAESCTGGWAAKQLSDIPGSSAYFLSGIVCYSNEAKVNLLGVPREIIERHGAVSAEVAESMALRCRALAASDYALSITGIAGPDGGTPDKPVGLVYIALADAAGCDVSRHLFGEFRTRDEIRERSCTTALNRLRLKLLA
ncbi:MAG: competence/damage-inducible protein A [Phycisphaerae bacterium]|nr:competence/damage-inducible protein A [Phycisphaerae bacterium]NUQ47776.1 competence/damage-inducible protein A [Phycisphaerae bacterium]